MKINEVKNLNHYLSKCYPVPIGMGFTAICYLMKDKRVLKLYLETSKRKELFSKFNNDMVTHFEYMENLKNDSYFPPEELIVKDGKLLGYISPYIKGKTYHYYNIELNRLLENYNQIYNDTIDVSKKEFLLCDLHDRNIIMNDNSFKLIDLDFGSVNDEFKNEKRNIEYITSQNLRTLKANILLGLLNVDSYYIVEFYDEELNLLFNKTIYREDYDMEEFLELLQTKYPNIKTKRDVRSKKFELAKITVNSYRKIF